METAGVASAGVRDPLPDGLQDKGRPAVLFVSIPVGVGGSTRSLANVLAHTNDGAVRVLAGPPGGRFVGLVRTLGAIDVHLPVVPDGRFSIPNRVRCAVRLIRYVFRNRSSLAAVHANGLIEMVVSLPATLVSRVPMVVWVHSTGLPPSVTRLGGLLRWLVRRAPVRFAAVSPFARDLVVEAGLTQADKIEIVPNPIDPADVLTDTPESGDDPSGAPAYRREAHVAFLGSPLERKGFQHLPELIERTVRGNSVRWLIFSHQGDDHLSATWERLRAMTATHPVSIEGKFTDVGAAYARCDIVVCPSESESFCRVAAEAMLNGIPVVGSDLEPLRALLGQDEAGLVIPVGDVTAMAKAVRHLAEDPELRRALGAVGRQRARAFAPNVIAAQLVELYGLPPTKVPA